LKEKEKEELEELVSEKIVKFRDKFLIRLFRDKANNLNCEVYVSLFGISGLKDIEELHTLIGKELTEFDDFLYEEYEIESGDICPRCDSEKINSESYPHYFKKTCKDCGKVWYDYYS